jgi:hypothetical protein
MTARRTTLVHPGGGCGDVHRPRRSIAAPAVGAFVYPHEQWNTDPTKIDRDHARPWDVRDFQMLRALRSGRSPQNFQLFTTAAIRQP